MIAKALSRRWRTGGGCDLWQRCSPRGGERGRNTVQFRRPRGARIVGPAPHSSLAAARPRVVFERSARDGHFDLWLSAYDRTHDRTRPGRRRPRCTLIRRLGPSRTQIRTAPQHSLPDKPTRSIPESSRAGASEEPWHAWRLTHARVCGGAPHREVNVMSAARIACAAEAEDLIGKGVLVRLGRRRHRTRRAHQISPRCK